MPRVKKKELIEVIIDAAFDKKAENIISIDLNKIESRFCDQFVICHAQSTVHVKSIADGIYRKVRKEMRVSPLSFEGYENANWVLLDYANIVVHVFRENDRTHYNLESLWADGTVKKHSNVVEKAAKPAARKVVRKSK